LELPGLAPPKLLGLEPPGLEPPGLEPLEPPGWELPESLGGVVTLRELPAKPMLVAVGADGAVWHTSQDGRIGRDGAEWFDLPEGAAPYGIAAAGDGGAFFSAPGIDRLGRISAGGQVEMVDLPIAGSYPAMVTVSADGAAWAALNAAGKLARWHDGVVDIVDIPGGRTPAAPVGIAAWGDRVWFADIAGASVGLADASGEVGRVTFDDPACRPHAVAVSPEGGCWVTLWGSGQLARVFSDGAVKVFDLPGEEPHGLALVGNEVWVAMESGSVVCVGADD
jgi:virginiamycin B lyase